MESGRPRKKALQHPYTTQKPKVDFYSFLIYTFNAKSSKHCLHCILQILVSFVFNFHFVKNILKFLFRFLDSCYLEMSCLLFTYFVLFQISLLFISSLILLWSKRRHCMLSILLKFLGVFYGPESGLAQYSPSPHELEKNVYSITVG